VMMADSEERITRRRRAGKLKQTFDRHRRKYAQEQVEQRERPLWR
jgi:hypothetical protein